MNLVNNIITRIVPILGIMAGIGNVILGVLFKRSWLRTDVVNKISITKKVIAIKSFFIINGVNVLVAFSAIEILHKTNVFMQHILVCYAGIVWILSVIYLVNKST